VTNDGREQTIIMYQDMIDSGEPGNIQYIPGEQRLFIAGGSEVFRVSGGLFQIFGTSEVLREV
jgi:hypothetical protein